MNLPDVELHRCYDEWGVIKVVESGHLRYMTFGEGGDQSAIIPSEPTYPALEYTQAMLLGHLFQPQASNILALGLGAGNLVSAVHAVNLKAQIDIVELRAQVANVAKDWFHFPQSSRLKLKISDAYDYLEQSDQFYDLIFSDLYLDHGMDERQLAFEMISNAYDRLSSDGLLVINLWQQAGSLQSRLDPVLALIFDNQLMTCEVEGGNLILFAFKSNLPDSRIKRYQSSLRQIQSSCGIHLGSLLEQVKRAPTA
jgi:spermidine synthase